MQGTRADAGVAGVPSRGEIGFCWSGFVHLLVVYVIWGSTYLAIRVAVREGSGFPPFAVGATRLLLAGALLLLGAAIARRRLRLTREELVVLAVSGLLLWTGGNGLVLWAEQHVDSGFAALVVGATPIWVAVMEALLERRPPSLLLAASLLTGFGGLAVLSAPHLASGVRADALAVLALLLASLSWGAGSLFQQLRPVEVSPAVSSGYQHLFGSLGFAAAALVFREPLPHPVHEAWLAWGYLVIFGSLLGFTSYVQALRLLPTSIAMTYAYVNPVIAVFLGRLLLHEPVTLKTLAGTALVLAGVAGVFRARLAQKGRPVVNRSPKYLGSGVLLVKK